MKSESILKAFFFIILVVETEIWAYFRCNNGQEIPEIMFCNGAFNCIDGTDEGYGCTKRNCRKGKFTCKSGTCKNIAVRCDGILDCLDASDEENCVEKYRVEIQPENCLLHQGKFLCRNKFACLDFSRTCDGKCDCMDCSDEHTKNCARFDSELCGSCTQFCVPTPYGPQCACNSSNYESSLLCKEIKNCTEVSGCEHHCTRFRNIERCLCYDGYIEEPDMNGQKCQKKSWLKTILFYSTVTRIKAFNLTDDTFKIVQDKVQCTALTTARNYIYYAGLHNNKGSIYKQRVDGEIQKKIVELDFRITSVSVDWVTNNVYFTNNNSLSVCTNNSEVCIQLMCCNVNNIVLAPKFGWMFFVSDTMTNENDRFIMKANMDGSDEEMLVSDESFLDPVSLTTDEYTATLYWLEVTERKLHSVSFNGSNRQTQYLEDEEFSSLAVLYKIFCFTKHRNNSFYCSSASFAHYIGHLDNSTSSVTHLYLHNPFILPHIYQTENPCFDSSCDGICLIRPSSPIGLNFTCFCENFTPTEDNKWCNKNEKYSVQKNEPTITEIYSTTIETIQTSTAQETNSTTELPQTSTSTTDGQEITYSNLTTDFTETTLTSDFGSSSTSTCSSAPDQETHSSTESNEPIILTSEKFNSPTESNDSKPPLISTAQGFDYVLIYSTVTKIKAWFLANDTHRTVQDMVDSTALVGSGGHVYYAAADNNKARIFRTSIDSGQTNEILVIDSQVTSIAVDWLTNNVYFTTNTSLSVCSKDGKICAELKCCNTDNVAVAPKNQWMFYTSKMASDDKRLIMRSYMDGSNEIILLDESFGQVTSLTVDESTEKLYWLDIKEQILHSVSFSGLEKKEKLLKNENRSYNYFAVLQGNFFFTLERNGFEWQFPSWSHFWEDYNTNAVKFVHVFSTHSNKIESVANPCEDSSCHGLCLLQPRSFGFTCICENFTSTDGNRWCNKRISLSSINSNILIQNKNEGQSSTEQPVKCVNFTLRNTHKSVDFSLAAESSQSVVSIQSDYHLIASGLLGFVLGISTASFVIVICFVFQKSRRKRNRKIMRMHNEMEM